MLQRPHLPNPHFIFISRVVMTCCGVNPILSRDSNTNLIMIGGPQVTTIAFFGDGLTFSSTAGTKPISPSQLSSSPPGVTDVDVQRLAAEPEDGYYTRIFREYIEARQAAGLSVEGITQASFTQKVRANEAMIKAKHKCSLVRFIVHTAAGRVSLRPIRLG